MKAQLKEEVFLDKMDESMFERTIYDCKWRYYEVAQALLKHRGVKRHRLMEP